MAEEPTGEEIFESELRQLGSLQQDSEDFLKRRITLWGIRWSIGFALIWGAVAYEPAWRWLWWAGAGLATLSLGAVFVGRALLNRKFDRVRTATEEARVAAELAGTDAES